MALQSTTALATVTLQAASSTVTFSGIPNTYRDLILISNISISAANNGVLVSANNDTTANYSEIFAWGNGSTTASGSGAVTGFQLSFAGSSQYPAILQIIDYSATNKHKTALSRFQSETYVMMAAYRWANTAAIDSLRVSVTTGTINAGTTFSLYGRIA